MSIRNKEYLEILKHAFDEDKFIDFIVDLLNLDSNNLNRNITKINDLSKQYKDNIQYYKHVANYNDGMNNIGVFIIKLNETTSTNARSMQRNFVATLLSKYNLDASLVAFYSNKEGSWRLSLVKKELSFSDKGIKEELTPAKRYSYLVGENESVHTAQEFLLKLLDIDDRKITLDDIEKQFDVEKVTKKFFEEYKEKYLELKEFLDKNEDFQTEAKNCDFDSIEFAKKLMGQIVFLYFLQKKGWLGVQLVPSKLSIEEYNELLSKSDSVSQNLIKNYFEISDDKYIVIKTKLRMLELQEDLINLTNIFKGSKYDMPWGTGKKDFIRSIFNQAQKEHKNFFDDYLEHFFYKGLNEKRENQYFPLFNCKIPFLNGGLFEPLNNYRWSSAHFEINNSLFSNDDKTGILDFLDLYNFTIDEEEPLEKEIAVDPEMLGKIFENLLDVNDRKSKGAFYTPREIVHYMCQESLANYLVNKVNLNYDETIQFIKYGDVISQYDWEQSINDSKDFIIGKTLYENLINIDDALINVKIADPAVGSGAFPLGMLNEIVKLRTSIQTYILIKNELGLINLNELNNTKHFETDIYKMKLQTIENSIYAVDIESSAVDITKLRLWLSLIVDYPNDQEPRPLPNLDCKIMQGDSLLDEFDGIKLFDAKQLENNLKKYNRNMSNKTYVERIGIQLNLQLDSKDVDLTKYMDEILKFQKEYFITSDNKAKKEIKSRIDSLQLMMVKETLKDKPDKLKAFEKEACKRNKPWFIWQLEFYDVFKYNGGFNIVIGNPPYVQLQKDGGKLANLYKNSKYEVFTSMADLYCLFYEKGHNILTNDGILCFITSNKWLRAGYGEKLRQFLSTKTNPLLLIDFAGNKVFDSATVDVNILEFSKHKNLKNTKSCTILENYKNNLYEYIIKNCSYNKFNTSENWVILNQIESSIKNKIEKVGVPLGEWDVQINYGIKTGYNDAFIIDTDTKDKLIKADPKNAEIIRPILRGKDIKRYKYNFSNLWIIAIPCGFTNKKSSNNKNKEKWFKENYSVIYKYFVEREEFLSLHRSSSTKGLYKRDDQGDYWWELRSCKYMNDFNKQKIIYPETTQGAYFVLDNDSFFIDKTCFIMTGNKLKFLQSVLSSQLFEFAYKRIFSSIELGKKGYQYNKFSIVKLPIIEPSIEMEIEMNTLNDNYIKTGDSIYLKKIDSVLYNCYNITSDEIQYINENK